MQLLSTSFLYESPASYVTEQPHFVNAVCKVSTNLEPLKLLAMLKEVEQSVGRQERYRWGATRSGPDSQSPKYTYYIQERYRWGRAKWILTLSFDITI